VEPELHNNENEIRFAVNHWRDSVLRDAQRPEWFWARQRARIKSLISDAKESTPKLVWAAVAATFALAIALVIPADNPGTPKQIVRVQPQVAQLSDHDLMLAVERTLNAGVPSSLEPAGMLAQEMDQAFQNNIQTQKSKETKNAN
jgi:hypothetical protein